MKKILQTLTGSLEEKKEWKRYKKRVNELPNDYRKAMEGVQTYMFNFAGGPATIEVLYNVLDMFEESANDNKKVSDIIGNDLGVFCEDIVSAVPEASWMEEHKKKIRDKINKKMSDE